MEMDDLPQRPLWMYVLDIFLYFAMRRIIGLMVLLWRRCRACCCGASKQSNALRRPCCVGCARCCCNCCCCCSTEGNAWSVARWARELHAIYQYLTAIAVLAYSFLQSSDGSGWERYERIVVRVAAASVFPAVGTWMVHAMRMGLSFNVQQRRRDEELARRRREQAEQQSAGQLQQQSGSGAGDAKLESGSAAVTAPGSNGASAQHSYSSLPADGSNGSRSNGDSKDGGDRSTAGVLRSFSAAVLGPPAAADWQQQAAAGGAAEQSYGDPNDYAYVRLGDVEFFGAAALGSIMVLAALPLVCTHVIPGLAVYAPLWILPCGAVVSGTAVYHVWCVFYLSFLVRRVNQRRAQRGREQQPLVEADARALQQEEDDIVGVPTAEATFVIIGTVGAILANYMVRFYAGTRWDQVIVDDYSGRSTASYISQKFAFRTAIYVLDLF